MRKMMKTAIAALLLSGTALTPALAQDCTSPTRCDELGYTFSAEDCEGVRSLICPFDSSKYFCGEAEQIEPEVGMILYSDGTVSNEVLSDKTPVGIVVYIDKDKRFAVALEETITTWSTDSVDIQCLNNYSVYVEAASEDMDGKGNTECILSQSGSYPAAEYCNTYKPVSSGTGSSGWYLPAAGELKALSQSYGATYLPLHQLSKTQLSANFYWSSSELNISSAVVVRVSDGVISDAGRKAGTYRLRCVLAF